MPGLGRKGVPSLPDRAGTGDMAVVASAPRPAPATGPVPDGPYFLSHGDVWRRAPGTLARGVPAGMSDSHVCDGSRRLAVSFADDVLLKHGEEGSVVRWVEAQRARAEAAGVEAADISVLSLHPLQGALDALNRCIAGYGGVSHMLDALRAMPEADAPPPPSYPR